MGAGGLIRTPQRQPLVVFAACAVILGVGAAASWGNTLDDAFISYRYAENLAAGHGLVFNPGERVEGFSNPLWVLLLAAAALVGVPAALSGKLLGLLAGLTLLAATQHAARKLGLSVTGQLLAGLALSTSAGVVFYTGAGMETILLMAVLAGLHAALLSERPGLAGLAAAAAALIRPEGILYAASVGVWSLQRRRALWALGLPVLALAGWVGFRWAYYGALLPNTFHAKIGDDAPLWRTLLGNIPHTAAYLGHFARQQLAWGLPLLLVPLAVARRPRAALPLLTTAGCAVFFCLYAGDDWMVFGRFALPALPVLVLLMAAGADADGPWRRARVVGMALALLPGLYTTAEGQHRLATSTGINPANHGRSHAAVGQWLAQSSRPGDRVVVNEIGAIGYHSGLPVTDLLGLIDPVIPGLAARTDLSFPEYVLAGSPRFVLLNDLAAWQNPAVRATQEPLRDKMRDSGLYARRKRFDLDDQRALVLFEALPVPGPRPGQGLSARYSGDGAVVERVDAMINFHWQTSAPAAGLPVDGFSAEWSGCVTLSEPRVLVAGADDPMQVFLDGVLLIDNPTPGARTIETSPLVPPGRYAIRVTYTDITNAAWVMLGWSDGQQRPTAIPWGAMSKSCEEPLD